MPSSDSTSPSMLSGMRKRDPKQWNVLSMSIHHGLRLVSAIRYLYRTDSGDLVQEVFKAVSESRNNILKGHSGDTFRGSLWSRTGFKSLDQLQEFETGLFQADAAIHQDGFVNLLDVDQRDQRMRRLSFKSSST